MIELTTAAMREMFPNAPQAVIDAFVAKQDVLTRVGVNYTRQRLAYFFANIEHECGGFTIRNLTENTNYSVSRAAEIFPTRAGRTAEEVAARFGDPIDKPKFFNVVYGTRMGNRPGTNDGWNYIGRGGPQWTGRDGYAECEKRTGLPALAQPDVVSRFDLQPEICVAFWDWKKLNAKADAGDFNGCVRLWNGGTNGLADRIAKLKGNDPVLERLKNVETIKPIAKDLPGTPPTPKPPQEAIDAATEKERKVRNAGGVAGGAGAANEGAKAGTQQPDKPGAPLLPSVAAWTLVGIGVAVVVIAVILIARKKRAVIANWF